MIKSRKKNFKNCKHQNWWSWKYIWRKIYQCKQMNLYVVWLTLFKIISTSLYKYILLYSLYWHSTCKLKKPREKNWFVCWKIVYNTHLPQNNYEYEDLVRRDVMNAISQFKDLRPTLEPFSKFIGNQLASNQSQLVNVQVSLFSKC